MKYFIIFERSFLYYVLIAILYRIMGKREVGELSIMDLIVSIFIAQIASIAIENYKNSIFNSLIPIGVLVILQILSSKLEIKSHKANVLLDGNNSVIIKNGKVNFLEMNKQRYNIEDLLTQLREQGVKSIEEVDYAILETSGKLSVFKKKDDPTSAYPLPVIIDGEIQIDTLIEIGKSKEWLEKELQKDNLTVKDIFYAFYKSKNLFLIKQKDIKWQL